MSITNFFNYIDEFHYADIYNQLRLLRKLSRIHDDPENRTLNCPQKQFAPNLAIGDICNTLSITNCPSITSAPCTVMTALIN